MQEELAEIVESVHIEADLTEEDAAAGRPASKHQAARLRLIAKRLAAIALHGAQQSATPDTVNIPHLASTRLRMSKAHGSKSADRDRIRESGFSLRDLEAELKRKYKAVAVSNAQLSRILSGQNRCNDALNNAIFEITGVNILDPSKDRKKA